jgi:endoglucanase
LIDLWKTIAGRYKTNVWIAGYDIYNEPRAPNSDDWWDLAERIIAGIRTVDMNHIIFVETSTFPDIELRKLDDVNIVYSYHDYDPFQITHAGISWSLDSPVPTTYSYPGKVLEDTRWVGFSNNTKPIKGQKRTWTLIDSGNVKPFVYDGFKGPIEFVSIRIETWGNTGSVYVDDLQVYKNGKLQKLLNGGFEEVAPSDPSRPRYWYFWSPHDVSGSLSTKFYRPSRGSKKSLKLYSNKPKQIGEWTNVNTFYTKQLFKYTKSDSFRLRGWVLAPENNKGGTVSIVLDYRAGVYKTYNSTTIRDYIQPVLNWAKWQNVPLYVGEFGSRPSAPGLSRDNIIRDKIALMNSEGLHWSLWTYRQPEGTTDFGLFTGNVIDTAFESILKAGL